MDNILENFQQYSEGVKELRGWLEDIEADHLFYGKPFDEEKHQKIFMLEGKYKAQADKYLAGLNQNPNARHSMPKSFVPIDHRNRKRR